MDFVDPYSPELGLANKYEFVTEIAPGVWKVYRKNDKMEYLAHDVTDMMTRADPSEPVKGARTELNTLLDDWAGPGLLHPLMTILNHEHLVSMIDMFGVQRTSAGENGYTRMYAIWEYCDAGNLGNLLVRAPSGAIKKSTEDDDDEDKRMVDVDAVEQNMFLPESFCWHVLLSVLKALAWLHDGAQYIAYNEEREDWEMLPHDPNWRTILHRNITPTNIFLGHPRRNEWYGKCKLGNYGSAAVSAHFHGDLENNVKAEAGKALAPPQGVQYQPLDELIRLDKKFGNMYPAHPDQPYTIVSEWRALGEIMQTMMVKPTTDNHLAKVLSKSVQDNLVDADYSAELKNAVLALMLKNPDTELKNTQNAWPNADYPTVDLVLYAHRNFQAWRASDSPEAKSMIPVEAEVAIQREEDARFEILGKLSVAAVDEILQKQDRKYGDEPRGAKKF